MNLRPFSPSDWYGFAGAESFPDGSEPLIGELSVEREPKRFQERQELSAIVILDANGLAFDVITEEGDAVFSVYFSEPFAARAVAMIQNGITEIELRAMPGAEVEEPEHLESEEAA